MVSRYGPDAVPTIWRRSEVLRAECQPLLSPEEPPGTPGRPAIPHRQVLDGILHVLWAGGQWQAVPLEFGSGSTCHRRFQQWVADGTWERLWHRVGLASRRKRDGDVPPRGRRDGA